MKIKFVPMKENLTTQAQLKAIVEQKLSYDFCKKKNKKKKHFTVP